VAPAPSRSPVVISKTADSSATYLTLTLRMQAWTFILYTVARDVVRGHLEQQFQAYGYIYSLVGSFAHLGGVIAGLTCLYFFLPHELLH
jgi:hypothetical protein